MRHRTFSQFEIHNLLNTLLALTLLILAECWYSHKGYIHSKNKTAIFLEQPDERTGHTVGRLYAHLFIPIINQKWFTMRKYASSLNMNGRDIQQ